jgi:MFS family permease
MVMTAAGFHIEVIGAEVGLTGRQSFAVFLPTAFIAIPTTLLAGWLSDRVRMKWILLAMLAGQALALTGMLNLADPVGRALFTVGYGVSGGLFGVVLTVTWPRYFGRRRLGAISGVNMSILVFASAIGPVLWSAAQGVTGSYAEVTAACWFLPALTLLAALKVKNPQLAYPEQDA